MVHLSVAIGQFFTFLLLGMFGAALSVIAVAGLALLALAAVGFGVKALVVRRRR